MQFTERHAWRGAGGVRKFLVPQRKAVDETARTIEFVVSTGTRDRDGDTVDPKGWKLDAYQRNPVVLWAHDASQPPVAKALRIGVDGGALKALAQFPDAETYAFADTVFRLYAGGYLSAVSAGFMPGAAEPFEADGIKGYRITEQELWEFSAVPIPANPDALVAAKAAKVPMRPYETWLEQALDEGRALEFRDVLSGTYIRLRGAVHPVVQADLAKRNAKAVDAARAKEAGDMEDEQNTDPVNPDAGPAGDGEKAGQVFTTSEGGDPLHAHEFTLGDATTSEAGDPPHVHAVIVADDGTVTIEDAEGHGHTAPDAAKAPPDPAADEPEAEDPPAAVKMAKAPTTPGAFVRWSTEWGVFYGYVLAPTDIGVVILLPMREYEDGWRADPYGMVTMPASELTEVEPLPVATGSPEGKRAKSPTLKDGRVLSKSNMTKLREARDAIDAVLAAAEREEVADKAAPVLKIVEPEKPKGITVTPELVGKLGDMIAAAVETEFRRAAGRVR